MTTWRLVWKEIAHRKLSFALGLSCVAVAAGCLVGVVTLLRVHDMRTQQILAEETGVASTIDPLAGSYLIESLTDEMEEEAYEYIKKIDDMGGMVKAVERNYPQMEIADAAYRFQREIDQARKVMVGVNKYATEEDMPVDIYRVDEALEERQKARTEEVKNSIT